MPSNHIRRIGPSCTVVEAVLAMSDGNPGAAVVMTQLVKYSTDKQEKGPWPSLSYLLDLDEAGLYGSDVWVAFKDLCGQDIAALARELDSDRHGLAERVSKAMSRDPR